MTNGGVLACGNGRIIDDIIVDIVIDDGIEGPVVLLLLC